MQRRRFISAAMSVPFRTLERDAVARALAEHDGVLALGGGAVLDPDTRAVLASHRVVWLEVRLAAAASRVGLARNRPVLALNPRATLAKLLDERAPHYTAVATATIVTDDRKADDIADDVVALVRSWSA